jgi:hypothetical protein
MYYLQPPPQKKNSSPVEVSGLLSGNNPNRIDNEWKKNNQFQQTSQSFTYS